MEEIVWSKFSLIYSTHVYVINRSPKHGRILWLSWYIRKEIHQTSNITDQLACFPLYRRCFQTFYKEWFVGQPREEDGFRAGYSTIHHLQVVNQLQGKANEYNMPLCFAFIDYEKAFYSIEFEPFFDGLKNQSVDEAYLNTLRNLYSKATSVLRVHTHSEKFKVGRGAKQEDNIFPKLFTLCLQYAIINNINWENQSVRIGDEYCSHLIFADDIVLIANSTSKLQEILQDIHDISKP